MDRMSNSRDKNAQLWVKKNQNLKMKKKQVKKWEIKRHKY